MSLSDRDSYDTAREPTNPSDGSLSSVSRATTTPSARPPPPSVHYSLPPGRGGREEEGEGVQEGLMTHKRVPEEEDDLDGVVYRTTTTGLKKAESGRVYDKVHEIRRNSTSTADFLRNFKVYIGSWGGPFFWISVYALLGLYPFAMIIVGSVNMKHCRVEPMIPVFMVVGGVFYLIKISFKIYENALEANKQHGIKESLQAAIWWRLASALTSMFLFAWFIAGCVWVYRAHGKGVMHHLKETDPLHCQIELFDFAFWTVTLQIIFLGVGLLATFLLITCLIISSETRRNHTLQ